MLQRKSPQPALATYAFLIAVGVDPEDGPSIPYIEEKLSDALAFVEGVGDVDIECLGEIELVPEDEAPND